MTKKDANRSGARKIDAEPSTETELVSVKARMSGALARVIENAPDEDLTVLMDSEYKNIVGDLKRMAARDIARDLYEQQAFEPPPTHESLSAELDLARDRRTPLITDADGDEREGTLLWNGQTLVIIARFKTGKTTLVLNLTRAFADGDDFLGRFKVADVGGRVGVWNYELPDWQWREWASEHDIRNADRVSLLHLRGYGVDLMRDHDAEWAVEWLRDHDVKVWVLDTWLAALNGIEENDNTRAGEFYRRVQQIARRAGVESTVWVTQQGTGEGNDSRGPARARGATALMDNADVTWTYTRSGEDRYLSAFGRDVDYPEFSVEYDWMRRVLTFGEQKSSRAAVSQSAIDGYKPLILDYLTELPTDADPKQRNTGNVVAAVGDHGKQGHAAKALADLDAEATVHHTHGARRAKLWWIGPGKVKRPCLDGDCGRGIGERVSPKRREKR